MTKRRLYSSDESYEFEALRALGAAVYGGADPGEVSSTMSRIKPGRDDSWLLEWQATADRVHEIAAASEGSGNRVSARQAYLRASNYYRTAEFYRREAPVKDPVVARLFNVARHAFVKAMGLMDTSMREVEMPYDSTTLPGYLFTCDDSGAKRPLVIYTNGYDSTSEESWFAIAAAALERGYNVLAYDGPGQGRVLREQDLKFRHDWEAVLSPVIDYAFKLPEVDQDRTVLFGYSFGAYLVARTAAHDHRAAALILNDGILDFHQAYRSAVPSPVMSLVHREQDRLPNAFASILVRTSTQTRWGLHNGLWTVGGDTFGEFLRRTRAFDLTGEAANVVTPALILDAEDDQFLKGQPDALAAALPGHREVVRLTNAEGAGEHCHVGSLLRAHQVMFDWLAKTIARR